MKNKNILDICKNCSFKGYFPEICKLHLKYMNSAASLHDDHEAWVEAKQKNIRRKTIIGALLGFSLSMPCLFVLPTIGFKLAILHLTAAKLSGGMTAAGGGMGLLKGIINNLNRKRKDK